MLVASAVFAQDAAPTWTFTDRLEIRANFRDSNHEAFQLKCPFPASFLPVGRRFGFEETPDAGNHLELSVVQLKLDAKYGKWFTAHAQVHAIE